MEPYDVKHPPTKPIIERTAVPTWGKAVMLIPGVGVKVDEYSTEESVSERVVPTT